jgi:lipid A 3-O-deacylase
LAARVSVSLAGGTVTFNMRRRQRWGIVVALARMATGAALAAACLWLAASPAWAQITIGSPGEPAKLALGGGAFDITPSKSNAGGTAGEVRAEYRFGSLPWPISPFVGVSGTTDGAFYGYGGFGFDINLTPALVLTPNVAAGYFARGGGTNLGSWMEFRSGAELAWRLPNLARLGVAVHHTSNAGLTKRNPGAQSVALTYSIPLQ